LIEGRKVSYLDVFADKVAQVDNPYDMTCVANEDDAEGMMESRRRLVAQSLGIEPSRIDFLDHAGCHAYYAYMSHPTRSKPLTILVADGYGDGVNGSIWLGMPGGLLSPVLRTGQCNIGRIYRYITLLLGMKPNEHEFKVMGLAPYSNSRYAEKAYSILAETLQVDGIDFAYKVKPNDHFFHFRDRLGACRFDGIAHALQQRTEELLLAWMQNAIKETGAPDLCLSGGVALNVKANMLMAESESVASLFVPPGSNDESLPIGAAFFALAKTMFENGQPVDAVSPFTTPYMGRSYTDKECEDAISSANLSADIRVRKAGVQDIADVLAGNSVVARFDGAMEFGPRALGNRSILADPRQPEAIRLINLMIKKRDFWMPFCPSILESRANDYLQLPDKPVSTSFMSVGFRSTPLGRRHLPAALHPYDNTARPQIVNSRSNPGYHELITAFEERTGVGCLLNTSFNLHGEPIVESPT
ncbi:MAG: carbamoyl transferase, partial [Rhodospirillales bacterium]